MRIFCHPVAFIQDLVRNHAASLLQMLLARLAANNPGVALVTTGVEQLLHDYIGQAVTTAAASRLPAATPPPTSPADLPRNVTMTPATTTKPVAGG